MQTFGCEFYLVVSFVCGVCVCVNHHGFHFIVMRVDTMAKFKNKTLNRIIFQMTFYVPIIQALNETTSQNWQMANQHTAYKSSF